MSLFNVIYLICVLIRSRRISPPLQHPSENADPAVQPSDAPVIADVEMDLDSVLNSPPVEDTLAARRARREAIKAKYAAAPSGENSTASAVQPPPSSAVSDQTFPTNSTNDVPPPPESGNDSGMSSCACIVLHS